jgi:hypothetical protein
MAGHEHRARRPLLTLIVVVAVAVGGFFGIRALWNSARTHLQADQCTVGKYRFDPGQAAIASSMVGVVTRRGLPERAATLVIAAGLQESKLRNIAPGDGDRDSVGVLQQRPSQGWGSAEQLGDVRFATGAFLDALVKVPNWQQLPLEVAIQEVQISADGSEYAKHAARAAALAGALRGVPPAGISCEFGKPTVVAGADVVAAQVSRDLPVDPPAHAGRRVSVPGAGWQTVAWFVANADRLGIESVSYDKKTWTRAHGWKPSQASDTAVVAELAQLKRD